MEGHDGNTALLRGQEVQIRRRVADTKHMRLMETPQMQNCHHVAIGTVNTRKITSQQRRKLHTNLAFALTWER